MTDYVQTIFFSMTVVIHSKEGDLYGYNMSVHAVLLFICVLGIIYTVAFDAQFRVSQAPEITSVRVGSNITFYCTFPIFQDNSNVSVDWWKLGESNFMQTASDNRKIFLRYKQGGAAFHLLNISAQDSGVYYCGVRNLGSRFVNGTGSTIKVSVPPTPLRICSKVPELNSSALNLVCKTNEFYPEALNLTWYKDGIEIAIGIVTSTKINMNGLYEGSSLLKETQPVRSGAVYTCQVSHLTLTVPANETFIVPIPIIAGDNNTFNHFLIYGCTGGGFIFLLLVIIIGSRRHLKAKGGAGRSVPSSDHREERFMKGATDEPVPYAALDFTSSNQTARVIRPDERTVYAQTKQARTDNKLTYVALELSGSKKAGKLKTKEKNTEYAQIRTTTQRGAAEGIYMEARVP